MSEEISMKEKEIIKKAAKKEGNLCCSICGRPSGFFHIQLQKRYIMLHSSMKIKHYVCNKCLNEK